jgi:hypothetical protein
MNKTTDLFISVDEHGAEKDNLNAVVSTFVKQVEELPQSDIRRPVHLILHNQSYVDTLKRVDLAPEMDRKVELYAYSPEDICSMSVLGIYPESHCKLDHTPITYESNDRVHLVLLGAGKQAESLATHAALVAHYPNFCRDNALRTRITWVVDSLNHLQGFRQRMENLLENCYCRTVKVVGDEVEAVTSEPKYAGHRLPFVDVEWEFVEADMNSRVLRYKLRKWRTDAHQQLTVAFCYDDDNRNLEEALSLAGESDSTPILLKTADDTSVQLLRRSGRYSHLIPFGLESAKQQNLSTFIRMGQLVDYAYCNMRETTDPTRRMGVAPMDVALDLPTEEQLVTSWNRRDAQGNPKLNTAKRWSNIYNAFTVCTKMRSLGVSTEHNDVLFALNSTELEYMAQVEHNRWCVEELILGYRPTTDKEHASILQDIKNRGALKAQFKHDDLRNFRELGNDDTGLSVTRYDRGLTQSIPLIAYAYGKYDK